MPKKYSQNNEDRIINSIFEKIGVTNKTFVEFGVGNPPKYQCNSTNLVVNYGWNGLMLDSGLDCVGMSQGIFKDKPVSFEKTIVTVTNINKLIGKYINSKTIDMLSIDIDYNDYWLWESIDIVTPSVVVIEYNASIGPYLSFTVPYNETSWFHEYGSGHIGRLQPKLYHGASLSALNKLANRKGYFLVKCDPSGINAFFVNNDFIGKIDKISVENAYVSNRFRDGKFGNWKKQWGLVKNKEWIEIK